MKTRYIACLFFLLCDDKISAQKILKDNHPNILLVIADQWRGSAMGFIGKEPVHTPFLDSLSRHALVLEQMVTNYPLCSPSRAMLFSGNYPLKNHVYTNVNSSSAPDSVELPTDMRCWSDVLKDNGYYNGYIGKWHLDAPHQPYVDTYNNRNGVAWNEWTPPARRHGFDYWYSYGTYDKHLHPMYWDTQDSRDSFHYVDAWGPIHETDKALAFMRNKSNNRPSHKPFALVVSYNPPHSEYQAVPQQYYEPYKTMPDSVLLTQPNIPPADSTMGKEYRNMIRYYYADITGIDQQIARLFDGLEKNDLLSNTLVVVMADHGNCLGMHNEISKNNPYEESLSIPFILYWKGHIVPAKDTQFMGSIPDIYPTLLELVGLKSKISKGIDGVSYAPYFLGQKEKHPGYQYIMGGLPSKKANINSGFRGVRTKHYKLVYIRKGNDILEQMFDLALDPFETKNIAREQACSKVKTTLQEKLKYWLRKTNDSFQIP
ncbi:MAG: sulfatase [Chitinophagaceae bacterium]